MCRWKRAAYPPTNVTDAFQKKCRSQASAGSTSEATYMILLWRQWGRKRAAGPNCGCGHSRSQSPSMARRRCSVIELSLHPAWSRVENFGRQSLRNYPTARLTTSPAMASPRIGSFTYGVLRARLPTNPAPFAPLLYTFGRAWSKTLQEELQVFAPETNLPAWGPLGI
jgi:hypothetical protein